MQANVLANRCVRIFAFAGSLLLYSAAAQAQEFREASATNSTEAPSEVRVLADLIRGLQDQVQTLNSQLGDLRKEQERTSAEARELRRELDLVRAQGAPAPSGSMNSYSAPPAKESIAQSAPSSIVPRPPSQKVEDRINDLQEGQEVMQGKIDDLYQTKVESGSKYRLRLSGIALLNLFENRGTVDNLDFPGVAESEAANQPNASAGAFGGTLRQSQIRLQAFGPDVAGARTSADVNLDFAGGFPDAPNGAWMGLIRMRTAVVRFDWTNTSVIAGQDRLFFAPLAPTSLATIAVPALSYSGNLWAWTPQVRVEHRITLSDNSSVSIQAGILDSVTGDTPAQYFNRYPSWGEQSGQPGYAARLTWSHRLFGQEFTVGGGGYYGRQNWGFSHNVDGWVGTVDLTLPLGKFFELTGEYYRGRAVAGFGGGAGQSVLLNGSFIDPATTFRGLDSMGGWAQLKFKPKSNFEINGALGIDNPYAGELRRFNANTIYPGAYTRNLSPLVNFIYQIRSDILISTEYRYLKSTVLDNGAFTANQVNVSLGYIF